MEDFFRKRLLDLAAQSANTCRFTFTPFLTEAELSLFHSMERELAVPSCIWGGYRDAERVMIRFGDPEALGYEEPFPIACLQITAPQHKFSEKLTHRDFLGAVMHLGVDRSGIGDILPKEDGAVLFCTEALSSYLCGALETVRHTAVSCKILEAIPETAERQKKICTVQVAAPRADSVIAKVFHLSRGDCTELFRSGKIFLNGSCLEQSSVKLKEEDRVSVRGYGKFCYLGITGKTRKDNLLVQCAVYV